METHEEIEYQVSWQVVKTVLHRDPPQSRDDAVRFASRLLAYVDNASTQDAQRIRAYQAKTLLTYEAQRHRRDEEMIAVFNAVSAALDLMIGNTVTHPLESIPLPSREEKKEALTKLKANDPSLFYEVLNHLIAYPGAYRAEKVNFIELMREI